ncbi:S4 domain-containing protein, partial [Shinella sp.]
MAKDTRKRPAKAPARRASAAPRPAAKAKPQPAVKSAPKPGADGKRVTLPRALSKLGFCSRTQAQALIAEGRVTVAGRVVTDPETWIDLAETAL